MDFIRVTRKQKPMKAVQVRMDNVHEVAEWCGGKVVDSFVRLGGAQARVPAIELDRPSKGGKDYTTAVLSYWIVEFGNEFRIYKEAQFNQLFENVGLTAADHTEKHLEWLAANRDIFNPKPAELSGEGASPKVARRMLDDAVLHSVSLVSDDNAPGKIQWAEAQPKPDGSGWVISDAEAARISEMSFADPLGVALDANTKDAMMAVSQKMTAGMHALHEEENVKEPLFKNGVYVYIRPGHGVFAGRKGVVKWSPGEIQPPVRVALQGEEDVIAFSPNELGTWNPLAEEDPAQRLHSEQSLDFKKGDRVEVIPTDSEWFQWIGVVKYVDHGRDGIVGVMFQDDVRDAREFYPTELRMIQPA